MQITLTEDQVRRLACFIRRGIASEQELLDVIEPANGLEFTKADMKANIAVGVAMLELLGQR